MLTQKDYTLQSPMSITKGSLCQYGIRSKEELQRLIDSNIIGNDFLYNSNGSFDKFGFNIESICTDAGYGVMKFLIQCITAILRH